MLDCPSCKRPHLTPISVVRFRALTTSRDGDLRPIVGNADGCSFIEVEESALLAIELILQDGRLDVAARRLRHETGTEFDLVDLIAYMAERDLVASIDACALPTRSRARAAAHFARIQPHALRWLHHPALLSAVLAAILCALIAAVALPGAPLSLRDLAPFPLSALNLVALFGIVAANMYAHELAHLFMARSFGVDAQIRLGRRGPFIVLETDVTSAWLLPRRERILIFLAGMAYNALVASTLFILAALVTVGILPASDALATLLRFASVATALPLVFQLFLWMRTDLYFVLVALSGERNLRQDARAFVAYRLSRIARRLRGELAERCGCGEPMHADDPFCLRCGREHSPADPNRYPFNWRSRHLLLWYGLAALVLTPLVTIWGLHRMAVIHALYFHRDAALLRAALARSDELVAAIALASLTVLAAETLLLSHLLVAALRRRASRWRARDAVEAGRRAARRLALILRPATIGRAKDQPRRVVTRQARRRGDRGSMSARPAVRASGPWRRRSR